MPFKIGKKAEFVFWKMGCYVDMGYYGCWTWEIRKLWVNHWSHKTCLNFQYLYLYQFYLSLNVSVLKLKLFFFVFHQYNFLLNTMLSSCQTTLFSIIIPLLLHLHSNKIPTNLWNIICCITVIKIVENNRTKH